MKKVILENLNKIIPLLSLSALIIGGLWLFIYSYVIVKELPKVGAYFLYYISAILIYIVSFAALALVLPIYLSLKNEEENSEGENKNINSKSKDRFIKDRLHEIFQMIFFASLLYAYSFISGELFILSYTRCYFSLCKIPFLLVLALFIIIYVSIFVAFLFFILKRDKRINIVLLASITIVMAIIINLNPRFFLIAPFQLLKLGYFEASLTLDKEYVEKTGLNEIYTKKCNAKRSDKPYEGKNKTQEQQQKEKKETQKLQEQSDNSNKNNQSQDIQNNKYYGTFKFFIFLRTDSEYIVGCSENSNVRIHIPSDKVIAIEY